DNSTWGQASLTSKLWHSPSFCNFNEPAAKPDLKLFQHEGPADVLVQYNEVREKDGSVRRRTFFLNRNIERLQAGRKPRFVHATTVAGLKPVPVLGRGSGQPAPPTACARALKSSPCSPNPASSPSCGPTRRSRFRQSAQLWWPAASAPSKSLSPCQTRWRPSARPAAGSAARR